MTVNVNYIETQHDHERKTTILRVLIHLRSRHTVTNWIRKSLSQYIEIYLWIRILIFNLVHALKLSRNFYKLEYR